MRSVGRTFKTGDVLKPDPAFDDGSSDPGFVLASHEGKVAYEDWTYVPLSVCEVVQDAADVPAYKAATVADLREDAVFKVEVANGHHFPVGALLELGGEWDGSEMPFMVGVTKGLRDVAQHVQLNQLSVVVAGVGKLCIRKLERGSGTIVKMASRSDDYEFELRDFGEAGFYIQAGCRWFTLDEARKHWSDTRGGTPLGYETFDILDLFEKHIKRLGRTA
jgi:hypothetical protein